MKALERQAAGATTPLKAYNHGAMKKLLATVLKKTGWSKKRLSLELGKSCNYVNSLMLKEASDPPGADFVVNLCDLAGSDIQKLFKKARK